MSHHLDALHNKCAGERAFIIGCGPSLQKVDRKLFNRLSNESTFGVNYLMRWAGIRFFPTFYCVDEWPDLWSVDELLRLWKSAPGRAGQVLPDRFYSHLFELKSPPGWMFVKGDDNLDMSINGAFSGLGGNLEPTAHHAGSVVMFALQLACWMGFEPIYLIGCDATRHGHVYEDPADKERNRQDVFQRAALAALKAMNGAGRTLIDLTDGGLLPIRKGRLKEVLQ